MSHKSSIENLASHVANEDDFKNIMDGFQKRLGELDNASSTDSEYSYYDLLTTFFTDSKGNNICEILSNINTNLDKIHNTLKDKK